MSDIIQLLPDSVANQIAAGEVIQRPASAVKELMENSIDAGSTSIKLIIKDSGKTLIQVIDNGCGMSETDARMSFERHATSKIKKADDLFSIRTMGFRGEAMASIAAIAHVELKTRRTGEDVGTLINIEGSEVRAQSHCSCPTGTSIAVKNLFFNVPARRNFLKSDTVELRHIIEEFQRITLAHPEISFSFHHNNNEVFHLEIGALRQRITSIFGNNYNQKLVPIDEETNIVKIAGYVGKPEFAKKTRGEQFFFINKRFIKNPYLHHAVQSAYKELLPGDTFPSYFLMMDIDPKLIDVNIHPTKTEVKFEDEKSVYAIMKSTIRQSLGKYNIAPSLDFEQETAFEIPLKPRNGLIEAPTIKVNPDFNPFKKHTEEKHQKSSALNISNKENWQTLYTQKVNETAKQHLHIVPETQSSQQIISPEWNEKDQEESKKKYSQIHRKYILTQIKSGIIIIDQQRAHERILYERFLKLMETNPGNTQQELFPQTVEFSTNDFELIKELQTEIKALGFDFSEFGKNTIIIHGIPSETINSSPKEIMEKLIENYKQNLSELKLEKKENVARAMAKNTAIKSGKVLSIEEMDLLMNELFACKSPYTTPNGKPTNITFTLDDLDKRFKN